MSDICVGHGHPVIVRAWKSRVSGFSICGIGKSGRREGGCHMPRLSWEQTWQTAGKETDMGLKIIRQPGGYHALAGRADKFWIELGTFQTLGAAQHAAEAYLTWRPSR